MRVFGSVGLIDFFEEGEAVAFGLGSGKGEFLVGEEVRDRTFPVGFDDRPLMNRRKEAGGESAAFVVGKAPAVGEYDEGRKIVSEVAKRVGSPCAEARKAGQKESRIHHVGSGSVNVCLCFHGHEKGHVINVFCLMGKHRGNPLAGLAVLLKFKRAFKNGARLTGKAFRCILRTEFLPVESGEFRLVVEGVHWASSSVHKELNDTFDFGGVMESAIEI